MVCVHVACSCPASLPGRGAFLPGQLFVQPLFLEPVGCLCKDAGKRFPGDILGVPDHEAVIGLLGNVLFQDVDAPGDGLAAVADEPADKGPALLVQFPVGLFHLGPEGLFVLRFQEILAVKIVFIPVLCRLGLLFLFPAVQFLPVVDQALLRHIQVF